MIKTALMLDGVFEISIPVTCFFDQRCVVLKEYRRQSGDRLYGDDAVTFVVLRYEVVTRVPQMMVVDKRDQRPDLERDGPRVAFVPPARIPPANDRVLSVH